MQLFNRISIIGLGLIGSSIARAAKKNNICGHITAFNKNPEVTKKAINLGIIDSGAETPEAAVSNADLVILCTPIGTYDAIAAKIAPHLKAGAIISDVGSVKFSIVENIGRHLSKEQLKGFVPAHPIAGSEKSGIDAGSEDLFNGRQTILTPISDSSADLVEKVKQFWQACGSNVDFMDAAEHDEIYATASHIPHFISFCIANAIFAAGTDVVRAIKQNNNAAFKAFVRLAGSNSAMWSDIFIFNKKPLISNINSLFSPPSLSFINNETDAEALFGRLQAAREKRAKLTSSLKENTNKSEGAAYVFMNILPHIIAAITIESVKNTNHVGGGFLGLTENILAMPDNFSETLLTHSDSLNLVLGLLLAEIDKLKAAVDEESVSKINLYIEEANKLAPIIN